MFDQIYTEVSTVVQRYSREIMIVGGIGLVGFAGISFYSNHRSSIEQAAQLDFSVALEEYQSAVRNEAQWSEVAKLGQAGYSQHSSSRLAPFFLAMQAQAVAEQGDLQQAIALFDVVVKDVAGTPLHALYAIKAARMKLASDDQAVRDAGLKALETLARDNKNQLQDEAMYYLGQHYADAHDMAQAQGIWQQLIAKFGNLELGSSPWATLAESMLE